MRLPCSAPGERELLRSSKPHIGAARAPVPDARGQVTPIVFRGQQNCRRPASALARTSSKRGPFVYAWPATRSIHSGPDETSCTQDVLVRAALDTVSASRPRSQQRECAFRRSSIPRDAPNRSHPRNPSCAFAAALKPKDTFKEFANCPEVVIMPGGTFTTGSPSTAIGRSTDEGAQHIVILQRRY